MSTASVNGISVGYDDEGGGGDRPPLVLVHGHPFDRSMWRPQLERFAGAGHRMIAADLRGYGESTVVPGTTSMETFARDVVGLADHLGIGRFVLGGLSMGGQIVMECHRLFPERIQGLVLADTTARAETEEGRRDRNEVADRLLRDGMADYAEEVLPKMVTPANLRRLPEVGEHVLRMMRGTSPEGAAAALRGRAERPDYRSSLARVTVPALVVVGTDDEYTPIGEARLMHETIPGATLAVIEDAGHLPNLERPDEFDGALRKFLDATPA